MKKILLIALFSLGTIPAMRAQYEMSEARKERIKELLAKNQPKIILVKGSKEYTDYYDKLRSLELKMNNSPSEIESTRLYTRFNEKLKQKVDTDVITKQELFFKWIEDNINSTDFKNADAAREEWTRLNAARMKSMKDNSDYYDYIMELSLTIKNFPELLTDVTMSVLLEEKK